MSDNNRLEEALKNPLWLAHNKDTRYSMDDKGEWRLFYYPILGNGQTQEVYEEPRALMLAHKFYGNTLGMDLREVPLRYIEPLPVLDT